MTHKLFISYSHQDEAFLRDLRVHLKPAERRGLIAPWFDRYLLAGDDIDARVRDALRNADLIALIISPDFLASDYCYDIEMKEAVARHNEGHARIIPIIARRSQWHDTPFGRLRATPTDGRPISTWADRDEAWTIVAKDIEAAANGAAGTSQAEDLKVRLEFLSEPRQPPRSFRLSVPRRVTQKDKDDFRHEAFEIIAKRFEEALREVGGPLSGRFQRLDANRLTSTLYREGNRVSACTIWTGAGHFGKDAVCYNNDDGGDVNSMNEWLTVEAGEDGLAFKAHMTMSNKETALNPEQAAEFFWGRFTEPLGWR